LSSTCFEPEGSSSGRRSYKQVYRLYIQVYLYIQPSTWRWTLGFETCRRH